MSIVMTNRFDRLRALAGLLLRETEYTTIGRLAEELGVSSRTIQSDLSSPELARLVAPATVTKKPNKGVLLDVTPAGHAEATRRLRAGANQPATQTTCDADLIVIRLM